MTMPPQTRDVCCLILGSGRGVRMGGPKALLLWNDGETLTETHTNLRSRDCGRVVVVTRAEIARRLRPKVAKATIVASSAPGNWGPAGSIAAAVRAGALERALWTLITPVDLIPTDPATVARMLKARSLDGQAVRPTFEGRGGHPVLVRTDLLFHAYVKQNLPTLRDVLRQAETVDVEVNDPNVRVDLDNPESYRQRIGSQPRFT